MRISYTSYNFSMPPLINEEEYNVFKYNFSINNAYYPFPTDGVIDKFKTKLIFTSCVIASVLIGVLFKPLEWLMIAGIIVFFIMGLGGVFLEIKSYSGYVWTRKQYYKYLKQNIIASKDYQEFLSMYKRR